MGKYSMSSSSPRAEEQGRERARRRQPDLGALDHGGGSEQGKKREEEGAV